jgi:hypothetical protein
LRRLALLRSALPWMIRVWISLFYFLPLERNEKILEAFDRYKIKGALFVCGKRVDSTEGKALLQSWDDRDHLIANHTYSHRNYNDIPVDAFQEDVIEVESLLLPLKNFRKLFRFPYLKEGDTIDRRDQMRSFLKEKGYHHGHVTVDASDWYVEERMLKFLKENPKADERDLDRYKKFYLNHIWERAQYYDGLSKKVFGRSIKHTLLIHHNLLNALFLRDLMKMFEDKGWKLISAKDAFEDPLFVYQPNILPAGESLIYGAAKEKAEFRHQLRYPAEDGQYEKAEMDKLGL